MEQPGVIPGSNKFLEQEDQEGNQLWRIVCLREQAVDYIKVMKKNGFHGQVFHYDQDLYKQNQELLSQLQLDLTNLNIKTMNMCKHNF